MKKNNAPFKGNMPLKFKCFLLSVLAGLSASKVEATTLNLAQSPLFLSNTVAPNIMLMMDDSGSMDWEVLTKKHWQICQYKNHGTSLGSDDCAATAIVNSGIREYYGISYVDVVYLYNNSDNLYSAWPNYEVIRETNVQQLLENESQVIDWEAGLDWRVLSNDLNTIYFDPEVTYQPWSGYDPASFTAAKSSPTDTAPTRDLTNSIYIVALDDKGFTGNYPRRGTNINYNSTPNGIVDIWDSHKVYVIASNTVYIHSVSYNPENQNESTDMNTSVVTTQITDSSEIAAIKQNFANWYQYHRRRFFNMKGTLSSLITTSNQYRYILGAINESNVIVGSPSDSTLLSTHNTNVLSGVFSHSLQAQGTPLRNGLNLAGSYYQTTGVSAPIQNSCQLNYTILMTDGHWNGSFSNSVIADEDGDGVSQTLADVAKYYYSTDLRNDLANNVPTNSFDTNSAQRMNTLVLSFGLEGSLNDLDDNGWPDVNGIELTENSSSWGDPTTSFINEEKVNDLWHAAFNSKGAYINVTETGSLLEGLQNALAVIDQQAGAASSVAKNTGSINSNSKIYQGRFDSLNWSGDLQSFAVNSTTGAVATSSDWSAKTLLNSVTPSNRVIIYSEPETTTDSYSGRSFRYSNLDDSWRSSLISRTYSGTGLSGDSYEQAVVDYLRGDGTYEGLGFRSRGGKLGDIVYSSPAYVSAPAETAIPYSTDSSYTSFKNSNSNRSSVIYVGANDGMLHAFSGTSGAELFGYIPSAMKNTLYKLPDPSYSHQSYMDGSPVIKDVYGEFSESTASWKTVLVTGFRAGGKGLAALDVTDPSGFSESNADNMVLWEFRAENRSGSADAHSSTDPDVGFQYAKPQIAKLNNGKWGVIIGNGFNSTSNAGSTGRSVLYVLDITDGTVIKKIETTAGTLAAPNALAEPVLVDTDNSGTVDYVYAGDFLGNVWKFDLSSTSTSSWVIANDDASDTPIPLFAAGDSQPITAGITVGRHQSGIGRMIYFGTGRYLTTPDNAVTGQSLQGFYGIWDNDAPDQNFDTSLNASSMLIQEVTLQAEFNVAATADDGSNTSSGITATIRETSNNSINWGLHNGWYFKLEDSNNNNNGERVVEKPLLRNGRIIFTTLIPSPANCLTGGSGWLMELDAISGKRLTTTSFDLNQDGVFDNYDYSYINSSQLTCFSSSCVPPSGLLFNEIISSPAVLAFANKENKYISGTGGTINQVTENSGSERLGRQMWRQIIPGDSQ